MSPGSTLEVLADCHTFEQDVRKWCTDSGKVLVSVINKGDHKAATIKF